MKLKFYGFTFCPYVHRILITLAFNKTKFDMEYIDINNKPEWFLKLSATGAAPLLIVDDEHKIFESNVINLFLDETSPNPTLPANPTERAIARAYMEYAAKLFVIMYESLTSKSIVEAENRIKDARKYLEHLETIIDSNGFFKGDKISIVDSTYAPFFYRIGLFDFFVNSGIMNNLPKMEKWYKTLINNEATTSNLSPHFKEDLKNFMIKKNSSLVEYL